MIVVLYPQIKLLKKKFELKRSNVLLKEKDKRKMSAGSQGNSSFLFFFNSSVAGVDLGSYHSTETSAAVLLRGKICFKFGSFDAWTLWGHLAENSLILSGKSNGTRARCTLSDTVGLVLFVP